MRHSLRALALSFVVIAGSAFGQFTETEGNDSKAAANVFTGLSAGSTITGNSTSATTVGLDYFRLTMATAAPGIYKNRMTLTTSGTAGHTGTLRGLTQTGGVINAGTDATLQTSSTVTTPPRYNQWYSFGLGEELFYRVTGAAATTADYVATMSTSMVTPVNLGTFAPGAFTFSTLGRTTVDTEIALYDSSFAPVPGFWSDDEPSPGTSFQSVMSGTLTPGTYYLAVGSFNMANNNSNPVTDRSQGSSVADFGGWIMSSSTSITATDWDFGITDINGTTEFPALKTEQYEIYWGELEVVPEPGSMIALGAGLAALAARRRRKAA
ncbi:MAG: hypothetical protein AMXMBFR81_26280 [Chthonomonas sp.]